MVPGFTSEQDLENAQHFGVCLICGTPRRLVRNRRHSDGKTILLSAVVYDCEHRDEDQDAALERLA